MGLFDIFKSKKTTQLAESADSLDSTRLDSESEGSTFEAFFRAKPLSFDVVAHEPDEYPNGETHAVIFDDDIELFFGDVYSQLEAKFSAVDGVSSAYQEDREQFVLTAKGLSEEELGARIIKWLAVL